MVLDVANEALTILARGVREIRDWLDLTLLKMRSAAVSNQCGSTTSLEVLEVPLTWEYSSTRMSDCDKLR